MQEDCTAGVLIVSEWLDLVLHLCWSFWRAVIARICQTPSWSLWSCGTDCAGFEYAFLLFLLLLTRIWKFVLLCSGLGQKPDCSSPSSNSTLTLSRLRITRSMILLEWLIRLMVRWFCHWMTLMLTYYVSKVLSSLKVKHRTQNILISSCKGWWCRS